MSFANRGFTRPLISLFLILICSSLALAVRRVPRADADLLPGWLGSDFQPLVIHPDTLNDRSSKMKVLDAEARIFLYENFLSDDNVVKAIERRISQWTLMPVGHGEGLQVLKYDPSQKYDAHWDYFFGKEGTENGGNRYATVLTYLADTEEGGETVFPNIPAPGGRNDDSFSECARFHLAAKPKKGSAVLFHSMKPNGELERNSMHAACPVLKGVKWSMPKWIHVGPYLMGDEAKLESGAEKDPPVHVPEIPLEQPGQGSSSGCRDMDELCSQWAAAGWDPRSPWPLHEEL